MGGVDSSGSGYALVAYCCERCDEPSRFVRLYTLWAKCRATEYHRGRSVRVSYVYAGSFSNWPRRIRPLVASTVTQSARLGLKIERVRSCGVSSPISTVCTNGNKEHVGVQDKDGLVLPRSFVLGISNPNTTSCFRGFCLLNFEAICFVSD